MKVDGKEFIRNLGIEQDKEKLVQEQQKLEELKRVSVQREQDFMNTETHKEESAFVDVSGSNEIPPNSGDFSENSVEDILLDTSNTNNNKKKYIMLGLGLVLLFIITVLVIRLISNNDLKEELNTTNKPQREIINDEILNKMDSNEQYQKVIERKKALSESKNIDLKEKKDFNSMAVAQEEENNVPLVIDTPKVKTPTKRDLFGLDKEQSKEVTQTAKKVVKEAKKVSQPKREIIVPPAKETNFTKKSTGTTGYFVQIGAFSRTPTKSLLKDILSKGYSYKIYKLTVKGKLYNKVLIGPYKTRADTIRNLSQIKSDFKNPNAYILKL